MELFRKVEKELELWKKSKSALIVYGSRQVGKTHILKRFLSLNFANFYYISLFNNIDAIKTLIPSKNIDDFILRLSLLKNTKINNDTCIFLDEIQSYYTYLEKHPEIDEYFDIVFQTKNFVEESRNRIVLSGSVLRLEMNNLITAPTGYLMPIQMFPLDFEEFLINYGITDDILNIVKNCLKKYEEIPDLIHNKLIKNLNEYILVGGMPKAINDYFTNKNFVSLKMTHKKIESHFLMDITQYAQDNEKLKIKEIYNLIPTELSNPTRKFIISDIPNHTHGMGELLSFTWLTNAGLTIPVYLTTEPKIPLISSSKRNQFKLFFEDVGLLSYRMFNNSIKLAILDNIISPNMGFIFENFVAQELHCHGFEDLYYYNNRKYGEVDFLLVNNFEVIPVEVKSGKNNGYHRALNNIFDVESYNLKKGIVLSSSNVKVNDNLIYLPLYAVSFDEKFFSSSTPNW